jgi:hypothetical protein
LRKGLKKPAELRAGRPSDVALVDEAFRERRTRKLPSVKQSTESRKIRAEIALHHPERDLPAVKTIERHLSRMSKAKSGRQLPPWSVSGYYPRQVQAQRCAISCWPNLTILERKRKDCLRRSLQIPSMLALPRHASMRTHSWLMPQPSMTSRSTR